MLPRRQFIRQFVFVTAGVSLIPACMEDRRKSSLLLKHMNLEAGQEDMLADLADALIPSTPTPGARDMSLHLFALKMMDDCRSPEDQQRFLAGLRQWAENGSKRFGKKFTGLTMEQKAELLQDAENKKISEADVGFFYGTFRHYLIQGYTSSQYYLTKVQVYQLVPGPFHGCVPVAAA